jgi:colanic acid/amylovoran biosynthesis protein
MVDTPVKILIAEYIPPLNKGELAILKGILKSFEVLGEVDVAVFSLYPKIDKERYPSSVKTLDIGHSLYLRSSSLSQSKMYPFLASFFAAFQHLLFILLYRVLGKNALKIMNKPLWKSYCKYDMFIICHDEVDCVNGVIFKFSPVYISLLAKALHKPIAIYANGTSQFTSEVWIWRFHSRKLWRILARYVLTAADLITVRDEGTLLFFKEISRDRVHVYRTADPAILLSPVAKEEAKKMMADEKIPRHGGPLIGIAMTGEVLSEAFKRETNPTTRYKKAIREIARLLDKLIDELDSTIVFIPHSIEPYRYRDDRIIADDIYQLMLNKHGAKNITKEYSPEELKGFIGQLDLLISCRVHAAINAFSMSTPSCVITRPWDKRAHNIIGNMIRQEEWIYDVGNLDSDKLFVLITDMLNRSGEIRRELPSIINAVKEKALFNGRLLRALISRLK